MEYPTKIIPSGRVFYNGISWPHSRGCPPKYIYERGQGLNRDTILYLTPSFKAAMGYAGNCMSPVQGYIRKYKTKRKLRLKDISVDMTQEEYDDVIADICPHYDGYYLRWPGGGKGAVEIAVCNASKNLRYISSAKCVGRGNYAENLKCGTRNPRTTAIKTRRKLRVGR